MHCDDALHTIADDVGDEIEARERLALDAHLAECATCAAAAADAAAGAEALRTLAAEKGSVASPPVDVGAVLAAAAPGETSMRPRLLPRLVRAAVVLLAIVGTAALLQTRVEAGEGRVALSIAVPGLPRPAAVTPIADVVDVAVHRAIERAELDAAVERSVVDALRPAFQDLATWMAASDANREELALWLEHRRRTETEAIAEAISANREGLVRAQISDEALWQVVDGLPIR